MIHRLLFAPLAASVMACSSGDVPSPSCSPPSSTSSFSSCSIATTKVTLPSSPLTTLSEPHIQRTGEGFLLTAPSSLGGSQALWARSSKLGELGPVAEFTPSSLFHGLATVGKDSAAEQLVVVGKGAQGVVAAVLDEQTGLPGPSHAVLTTGTYGQVTEVRMASSLDGYRAVFVHGNRVIGDPNVIVLGADAVRHGEPVTVTTGVDDHFWECLDVIPTAGAGAISVMESRYERHVWHLVEVDAAGAQVFKGSVNLTEELGDAAEMYSRCPLVTLTPEGFTALLKGSSPDVPAILLEINRATFAEQGATTIALAEGDSPIYGASAIAAMGGGYAVHFRRESDDSRHIGFFSRGGCALPGAVSLPAEVSVGRSIHSAPGVLLLSSREDDGPWGWLEATCGAE